jgi:uncharacterized protein (DUF58 family)
VAAAIGLLTHDFFPGLDRRISWIRRPIVTLLVAMGMAIVCAAVVTPEALISGAAILVVILLGYGWPQVTIRGLSGRLRFVDRRVVAGDTARAVVTVRNVWPWPVWGVTMHVDLGSESPACVALARIGGWSQEEFTWECVPECRGVHPRRPPRLATSFPFGLATADRAIEVDGTLLAWPRCIDLDTLADAAETLPAEERFSETRIGDSGDMLGTRPFRHGDSLRRVHWACTARLGTMIVCERQAAVLAAVRVVFDSDPAVHSGTGPTSTLEQSIRLAASVCLAYQRANALVECCYGHESIRVAAGGPGRVRFLDTLARFHSCEHDHHDCQHTHRASACQRIHHGDDHHAPRSHPAHRTPPRAWRPGVARHRRWRDIVRTACCCRSRVRRRTGDGVARRLPTNLEAPLPCRLSVSRSVIPAPGGSPSRSRGWPVSPSRWPSAACTGR